MRKLLLVNTNTEKLPYPVPPLGICLIASFLKDYYDVKIYDGMFDEGRNLEAVVRNFNPDFIGFSIRNVDEVVPERWTFFLESAFSLFIEHVRKISNVPLIVGGSGYSIFPSEILEYTAADYGIAGEGEETLLALLQKLERGEDVSQLPNVYTRTSKGTGVMKKKPGYDRMPWSDIDQKLDFNPYMGRGVYSIQTKRGCALQCIYCSYPLIEGKQYRLRTPSSIASEIEEVSDRLGQCVTFEFVDSTFNEPQGHAEEICRELIRRKIKVRMRTMGVNPRNTSAELFSLMKEAGFAQIDVTPDSASPAVIKGLRKGFTMEDIRRTANLIREFDMPSMWFFLFGGPGENSETFSETIRFIDDYINPKDLVYLSGGLRVYPGTQLYKVALKEGLITTNDNLLHPPLFYFSKEAPQVLLKAWIDAACSERLNCLPGATSNPPEEMLREAVAMRQSKGLTEPMFRTLLRIRKGWKEDGRL